MSRTFCSAFLASLCVLSLTSVPLAGAQVTRYVRADAPLGGNGLTWATAFRRLPDAVNVSAAGDSVWVAAGRYTPLSQGVPIELRTGVGIYGGFVGNETMLGQRDWAAHETIISGDMLNDDDIGGSTADNAAPILSAQFNILASAILDGFTVRSSGTGGQAGGLRSFGSPTIRNCTFTRNISIGAAAVFLGTSAGPASPRLTNCRFVNNGNLSSSNQGVLAVDGAGGLDARIVGCTLIGNFSQSNAILAVRAGSATVVNCAVVQNTVQNSEAAVLGGLSPLVSFTMINTTIAGNRVISAGNTAGLRVAAGSILLVRNCILWGNTVPGAPVERSQFSITGAGYRLDYCRVQGWTGATMGTATSGADPLLADLDGPDDLFGTGDEDVRLLAGSSAIDAGNNFYVWPDISDLDGDGNTTEPTPFALGGSLRFIDDPTTMDTGVGTPPIVDIGPYEFGVVLPPCTADFNHDGFVNSQDFFDFVAAFFQGCP